MMILRMSVQYKKYVLKITVDIDALLLDHVSPGADPANIVVALHVVYHCDVLYWLRQELFTYLCAKETNVTKRMIHHQKCTINEYCQLFSLTLGSMTSESLGTFYQSPAWHQQPRVRERLVTSFGKYNKRRSHLSALVC